MDGVRRQLKHFSVNQVRPPSPQPPATHWTFCVTWCHRDSWITFVTFSTTSASWISPQLIIRLSLLGIHSHVIPSNISTVVHNVDHVVFFGYMCQRRNDVTQKTNIFWDWIRVILCVSDNISTKIRHFIFFHLIKNGNNEIFLVTPFMFKCFEFFVSDTNSSLYLVQSLICCLLVIKYKKKILP